MRVQDRKFHWRAADFCEGDAGAALHCHHPADPFDSCQRSPVLASMEGRGGLAARVGEQQAFP